ncbi:hypothetical protein LLG95_01200 [bacterium]|nr:hypothetical protein [bacterium]
MAVCSRAASDSEQLERAKTAFTNQNYKLAAQVYEKLIEQAPHDPRLLYNQGTAYAYMGERGLAQWRYLQALRYAPRDSNIRQNLAALDPDYRSQIALTPLLPVELVYGYFTGNEWAGLAGSATFIALALGTLALWRPRGTRLRLAARKLAVTAVVLAAIAWPFAMGHYYQENISTRGVTVVDDASIRSGPSETSRETWKLKAGVVVDITDDKTHPDWPFVSMANRGSGFINRNQIRKL